MRGIKKLFDILKYVVTATTTIYLTVAAVVIALDPLGFGEVTDKRSRDAMLQATAPFYPESERENISIIFIDDASLDREKLDWPVSFDQYADLLMAIGQGRPRAVFLDLLFLDDKGDPEGLARFVRVVERLKKANIPVFVAGAEVAKPAQGVAGCREMSVLEDVRQAASGTAFVAQEGFGDLYPAFADNFCSDADLISPAALMYLVGCELEGVCPGGVSSVKSVFSGPLSLRWGEETSPVNRRLYSLGNISGKGEEAGCPSVTGELAYKLWLAVKRLGAALFDPVFMESSQQPCLYHPHTSAAWLMQAMEYARGQWDGLSEAEATNAQDILDGLLGDRYVFVGTDLRGIPDVANSPVQGVVPGVVRHAMALDNMLALGNDYMRPSPTLFWNFGYSALLELIVLAFAIWAELRMSQWVVAWLFHKIRKSHKKRVALVVPAVLVLWAMLLVLVVGSSIAYDRLLNYEPVNWAGVAAALLPIFGIMINNAILQHRAQNSVSSCDKKRP